MIWVRDILQVMQPIEVVFEGGQLRPMQKLPLKEQQRVWILLLPQEELASQDLARLAAKSPSVQFLADPAEDLYSLKDGQPL